MTAPKHVWVALSPHGFGHAAMTAPVIKRLQERVPGIRITLQTSAAESFLKTRYKDYQRVERIADFGFRMISPTKIDIAASTAGYADLNDRFETEVAENQALMEADRPDFVLSNVAFIPLAAAQRSGIPCAAMSSINWADMYRHYINGQAEILQRMTSAYEGAAAFLRCTPAQEMTFSNQINIGPIAEAALPDRAGLHRILGLSDNINIGLAAFGGINHVVDFSQWPHLTDWVWLAPQAPPENRSDIIDLRMIDMEFNWISASVDVIVTKPGYGTFTEAGLLGMPVLYSLRPDWPECPHLDDWLSSHTRSLGVPEEELAGRNLQKQLRTLFSMPKQGVASADGIDQAVDFMLEHLSSL